MSHVSCIERFVGGEELPDLKDSTVSNRQNKTPALRTNLTKTPIVKRAHHVEETRKSMVRDLEFVLRVRLLFFLMIWQICRVQPLLCLESAIRRYLCDTNVSIFLVSMSRSRFVLALYPIVLQQQMWISKSDSCVLGLLSPKSIGSSRIPIVQENSVSPPFKESKLRLTSCVGRVGWRCCCQEILKVAEAEISTS